MVTNRELKEKVQQVEETEGRSGDGSDPQLFLENRVRMLLRRVVAMPQKNFKTLWIPKGGKHAE